jgi:heterodisulfide reductase subunit C
LDKNGLQAIQEGIYLCTNCDRCTVGCPSGIILRDLWQDVREALVQRGLPEPLVLSPYSFFRGLNRESFSETTYQKPLDVAQDAVSGDFDTLNDPGKPIAVSDSSGSTRNRLPDASTYAYCFGCQNCSTVCPVVGCYENPKESLGLLPHQIMNCLGLGLVEMASGPKMLWRCVTCYQCQEHCPQNVAVTDLLYRLKNLSATEANRSKMSFFEKSTAA